MIKILSVGTLICIFIFSCKNPDYSENKAVSEILEIIFTSDKMTKDFPLNVDTIYILKPKNYNSSWAKKVKDLHIKYLEDIKETKYRNIPGTKEYDSRWRFSIVGFDINSESAAVTLYNYNTLADYNYLLKKKKNKWRIEKLTWGLE